MSASAVLQRLSAVRIIPVIVIDDADLEALGAISDVPELPTGAGTVLSVERVDRCVDAGHSFS